MRDLPIRSSSLKRVGGRPALTYEFIVARVELWALISLAMLHVERQHRIEVVRVPRTIDHVWTAKATRVTTLPRVLWIAIAVIAAGVGAARPERRAAAHTRASIASCFQYQGA